MDATAYIERNRIIKELFDQTYAEYLKSPLWERIRLEVLRRFGNRCIICRDVAYQVHHSKYTVENLCGGSYKHLSAVCRSCHEAIERKQDGAKRAIEDVQALFKKLKKVDQNPPQRSEKEARAISKEEHERDIFFRGFSTTIGTPSLQNKKSRTNDVLARKIRNRLSDAELQERRRVEKKCKEHKKRR